MHMMIEVIPVINRSIVKNYYNQLKSIAEELGIETGDQLLATIMKMPDTLKTERPELSAEEWNLVKKQIEEAPYNGRPLSHRRGQFN